MSENARDYATRQIFHSHLDMAKPFYKGVEKVFSILSDHGCIIWREKRFLQNFNFSKSYVEFQNFRQYVSPFESDEK